MLRELLKLHPSVEGPLYERERIWCYGNRDKIGRALEAEDVTPDIRTYIRRYFDRQSSKCIGKRIVDKNVNNSLRISYLRNIFSESPIVHIVRDGRDASCSIRDRWRSPADVKYIFRNRAFPLEELPYFLKRQLKWYVQKVLTGENHVRWWGPKFDDMEELVRKYSLLEVCGIQWKRCTEAVLAGLDKLDPESYIQVKYEDLVLKSINSMERICEFLELRIDVNLRIRFKEYVQSSSIGRWHKDLTPEELDLLTPLLEKTLVQLSYS